MADTFIPCAFLDRTPPIVRPSPHPAILTNYIISNSSLLPDDILHRLKKVEKAWQDGELTQRGYLHQKAELLEHHLELAMPNGTQEFGHPPREQEEGVAGGVRSEEAGLGGGTGIGGGGGGGRKEHPVRAGKDNRHMELKKMEDGPARGLSRKLLEATIVRELIRYLIVDFFLFTHHMRVIEFVSLSVNIRCHFFFKSYSLFLVCWGSSLSITVLLREHMTTS